MSLDNDTGNAAMPAAIAVGDFNVGKSFLLNAIFRENLLFTGREESRIMPTLVARGGGGDIAYAAFTGRETEHVPLSRAQFLSARRAPGISCECEAAAALIPKLPFRRLLFVDTAGASSEAGASAMLPVDTRLDNALFLVTTTIEYWPARHTMSLMAEYHERFPGRFVVVANMADTVNPDEIRRIVDKATSRMARGGISPAPPFFALSARLEAARAHCGDEYRGRVKREVRELCDAGFDALRVALYEFEARHAGVADRDATDFQTLRTCAITDILTRNNEEVPC